MINKLSKFRSHILEWILVLLVVFLFTPTLRDFSEFAHLQGGETSYLINSGVIAARIYEETGAIPRWNPFIGRGEPLIENPFSYVLNPLMVLPIFAFGANHGPLVGVLLHIVLSAMGGWTLAYIIGLRWPGRLLLALLLGGNGSMAGAISLGFYQMGLSQAYVPWVLAGLLGTIKCRHSRWTIGVLVGATVLMLFAGTFWYVLPTAISCLVLAGFQVIRRNGVDWVALRRLLWAGVLIMLVAAVRLLPQYVHREFVDHLWETLDNTFGFFSMLDLYFVTEDIPGQRSLFYHFILPPVFAVFLILVYALLRWRRPDMLPSPRWRLIVPAMLLIVLYVVWSQEKTPFFVWLYGAIPFFAEWRFVSRMLAAGAPLLALIVALVFDDVWGAVQKLGAGGLFPMVVVAWILLFAGYGAGTYIMGNWSRITGAETETGYNAPLIYYLRANNPQDFLPIMTWYYFSDYFPFYEVLARASFGNPDYQPGSLPPTVGTKALTNYYPQYVISSHDIPFAEIDSSYRQLATTPDLYTSILWESETPPTYAYTILRNRLIRLQGPLTRDLTTPVESFEHNIDSVRVTLDDYIPGSYLVITEVAYPGWKVRVNGINASLEVVGELVAVQLPESDTLPLVVEFCYEPDYLYWGGALTVFGVLLMATYLLQLDKQWVTSNYTSPRQILAPIRMVLMDTLE